MKGTSLLVIFLSLSMSLAWPYLDGRPLDERWIGLWCKTAVVCAHVAPGRSTRHRRPSPHTTSKKLRWCWVGRGEKEPFGLLPFSSSSWGDLEWLCSTPVKTASYTTNWIWKPLCLLFLKVDFRLGTQRTGQVAVSRLQLRRRLGPRRRIV